MADVDLKKIYILLGAGIFILSFSGILIKLATAPPLIIAFYRMLFTSIIITPVFFYKYKGYLKYFLDYRPAVVGVFLSIHFFLWMSAFEYTSVANAVIFIAIQPLFTLLLEFLFAREDLREGVILGIIFALIGSVIISIGDLNMLFAGIWGDLLALSASFFAACYLFVGRSLRKEIAYFPYIYIIYTYTAIFLGLLVLITETPVVGYQPINYLYFIGLAVGPTLLGHSSLNYSVRFIPTTIVSLAILGEPVITTILAWIIIGENITMVTTIGGMLIMTGIYLAVTGKNRRKNREILSEDTTV